MRESFVGRPSLSVDGDHVGGEGEEVVARLADHSRVPGPLRGGQFVKTRGVIFPDWKKVLKLI